MRLFLAICLALFCAVSRAQTYTRSFATVADLLSANPNSVATNAWVAGFSAAGDGGDGGFVYIKSSTSSTNQGAILKPISYGGRWFAVHNGVMDVRRFGAKADDSTDAAPAINDALLWGVS